MASHDNLPLVLAALVCEQVLEEKDGVLSVTRIVDRFFVQPPAQAGALVGVQFRYLAILKRGSSSDDEHEVSVVFRFPSQRMEVATKPAVKIRWPGEGEDNGVNLNLTFQVGLPEEGLYWIDLIFDGSSVASTPFRVIYGPPTS
jgi:hypothetical protein